MKKSGFTIIEFVLSIAILGIIATAVAPTIYAAVSQYSLIWSRRAVVAEVQSGMDRMLYEIRLIPGSAQVTTIGASSFTFQYPTGTSITYSLSGGNILRGSDILIAGVTALAFAYYDEDGNVTATAANVRSVGITLTATVSGSTAYSYRSRVFIHNTGNRYTTFTSP
jgi:prepilin-type N-terminal cleavage/methylation domain-containing protein